MSSIVFGRDMSSGRPFSLLSPEAGTHHDLPVTVSTVHKAFLAGEKLAKFRGAEGLGGFDSSPVNRVQMGWIVTYQPFPNTLFYLRPPVVDEDPATGKIDLGPYGVLDYGNRSVEKWMKFVGTINYEDPREPWASPPSKVADSDWYIGGPVDSEDDGVVTVFTNRYHTRLIQRILYRRMLFLQNCCFEKDGEGQYRFSCKGNKVWLAPHGSSSGELPDIRKIRARPFQMTGDIPLIAKYPKAFEDAKESGNVMSWIASDKDSPVCAYHVNQNPEEWITSLCYRFHSSLGQMKSQAKDYDAFIMRHVVETAKSGNAPWQWFHDSGPFGDEDSQIENKLIYRVYIPKKNWGGDPGHQWYYDDVPPLSGYVQREVEAFLAKHGYSPFGVRYWRPVPSAPVNIALETEIMSALSGGGLYFKKTDEETGHIVSERLGMLPLIGEYGLEPRFSEERYDALKSGCAFDLMLQICAHDNVVFSVPASEFDVEYREVFAGYTARMWLKTHCGKDDDREHDHDEHIGAGCFAWQKNVTHNVNFEIVPHVRMFTHLPPREPQEDASDSGSGSGEGGQE